MSGEPRRHWTQASVFHISVVADTTTGDATGLDKVRLLALLLRHTLRKEVTMSRR